MTDPGAQVTRRTLLRAGAALGAVVAGGGLVSACTPSRSVLAMGDSIMSGAKLVGFGAATAGGATTWKVDAVVGRGTNRAATDLAAIDLRTYWMVVVATGTNDYLDDAATFGTRIDRVMRATAGHPRVRWVNVDANTTKLAPAANGVNAALAAAPRRWSTLRVGDWSHRAATLSGFDQQRAADGVHYSYDGYRQWRAFVEALAV